MNVEANRESGIVTAEYASQLVEECHGFSLRVSHLDKSSSILEMGIVRESGCEGVRGVLERMNQIELSSIRSSFGLPNQVKSLSAKQFLHLHLLPICKSSAFASTYSISSLTHATPRSLPILTGLPTMASTSILRPACTS